MTPMGFPPLAWYPEANGFINDGSLPVLAPGVKMADPGFFADFWTVPGYLGADPNSREVKDRLVFHGEVKAVHVPGATESVEEEAEIEHRNGVDTAWKKMLTNGKDAWIELYDLPEGDDLYLKGVNITFITGEAAGKQLLLGDMERDKETGGGFLSIGMCYGMDDLPGVLSKGKPGDELTLEDLIDRKLARDPTINREDALHEVVADGCELMLRDSSIFERLAQTDQGLAKSVADYIKEYLGRVYNGLKAIHREASAMGKYIQEQQALWDEALFDALTAETEEAAETETPAETGERGKFAMADADISRHYIAFRDSAAENKAVNDAAHRLVDSGRVVNISEKDLEKFPESVQTNDKKSARDAFGRILSIFVGKDMDLVFGDNSVTVYLTRDGLNHSVVGQYTQLKAAAYSKLRRLLRNAEYAYSSEHDPHAVKQIDPNAQWDTFVSVARYAGRYTPVVFKIRTTDRDVRSQIYNIFADDSAGKKLTPSHGHGLETQSDMPNYEGASASVESIAESVAKSNTNSQKTDGRSSRADVSEEDLQQRLKESESARKKLEAAKVQAMKDVEYWRNETRIRKLKTARPEDVRAFTRNLLKSYPYTSVKATDLYERMQQIADGYKAGKKSGELHALAMEIAEEIIENSNARLNEEGEVVPLKKSRTRADQIREFMRGSVYVSEQDRADIAMELGYDSFEQLPKSLPTDWTE